MRETVLRHLGTEREEVLLGPSLGEDGAAIKVGNKVIISAMDPITGAIERIGWLAVNINANDVATFGVPPSFFSSCILLPSNSTRETVQVVCKQIDSASRKLGLSVIGGHSEVTLGLDRPIVIGCAIGITEPGNYVTSGGARRGDRLILTKGAGIEGTAVLAMDRHDRLKEKVDKRLLNSATGFYDRISVVQEAVLSFKVGGVTAMHDPTEGGIAGGIHEMADASSLGVKIYEKQIPIARETTEICRFFNIDPLQLVGSGALLISAGPNSADRIVDGLIEEGIEAGIIGNFLENPTDRFLISSEGNAESLVKPECDHLWIALEK